MLVGGGVGSVRGGQRGCQARDHYQRHCLNIKPLNIFNERSFLEQSKFLRDVRTAQFQPCWLSQGI